MNGRRAGSAAIGVFVGLLVAALAGMLWILGALFVQGWQNGSPAEHRVALGVVVLGLLGGVIGWRLNIEIPDRRRPGYNPAPRGPRPPAPPPPPFSPRGGPR